MVREPETGTSRDRLFREVVVRAVTAPPVLFLATFGGLLALHPVAWPAGVGGLVAAGGWVWWRIRCPEHARESGEELRKLQWRNSIYRLERLSAVLAPETSAALSAILNSQERLLGMYEEESRLLPHTRTELTSLLERCLSLAEKRHQLQTHLAAARPAEALRQAEQLEHRIRLTDDSSTRALFEQALDEKRQELRNYRELEDAIGRIDGQLAVVQCTFDNVLSRVVRMQSLREEQEVDEEPVASEIRELTQRVSELEASVTETITLGWR